MPKENDFAMPQADYERPKPAKPAAQASMPPAEAVRAVVLLGGESEAVVRLVLNEADGEWSAVLQHDYADLDTVGRTFQVGERLYEVTAQDGRTLTLEVA